MNVVTDTIQALRSMRKRQVWHTPPRPPVHCRRDRAPACEGAQARDARCGAPADARCAQPKRMPAAVHAPLTGVLCPPRFPAPRCARRQLAHQVINLGLIVTSALMYGLSPRSCAGPALAVAARGPAGAPRAMRGGGRPALRLECMPPLLGVVVCGASHAGGCVVSAGRADGRSRVCARLCVRSVDRIWKSLMVITHSESPVVVVLSGSMEPAFQRGDILFLWLGNSPFRVGEIVVFKIEGRDIPIVHRVIKVHEKHDGTTDVLTKGDNNDVDDRGL